LPPFCFLSLNFYVRGHILLALREVPEIWGFCWVYLCHRQGDGVNTLNIHDELFSGCGLATLEVAANSYISVLGTPKYAAARLNFSQGFQGVASFSGPLIASRWFFRGANATKLDTVQWYFVNVENRMTLIESCLGYTSRLLVLE